MREGLSITQRRDFKDSSGTKPGSLFPLAEIWMPVQTEVDFLAYFPRLIMLTSAQIRTLLNDYITDEEQGVVSGRNPISSINEVLREGRYVRDRSKVVHSHSFEKVIDDVAFHSRYSVLQIRISSLLPRHSRCTKMSLRRS